MLGGSTREVAVQGSRSAAQGWGQRQGGMGCRLSLGPSRRSVIPLHLDYFVDNECNDNQRHSDNFFPPGETIKDCSGVNLTFDHMDTT